MPWVPAGGYRDIFPWGQCTWWAALNHLVTWNGNAKDWAHNAAAQGVALTHTPSIGAIVVYAAGHGYSGYGHVAIVVSASATRYTISEMNYVGLGVVDERTLAWPDPHVIAFIPGDVGSYVQPSVATPAASSAPVIVSTPPPAISNVPLQALRWAADNPGAVKLLSTPAGSPQPAPLQGGADPLMAMLSLAAVLGIVRNRSRRARDLVAMSSPQHSVSDETATEDLLTRV